MFLLFRCLLFRSPLYLVCQPKKLSSKLILFFKSFLVFWPTVYARTATRKRNLAHRHVATNNNNNNKHHVEVTEDRPSLSVEVEVKIVEDLVRGPGKMTDREEGLLRKGKFN